MIMKMVSSYRLKFLDLTALRRACRHFTMDVSCNHGPLERYKRSVKSGSLRHDSNQEKVVYELDKLFSRLAQHELDMEEYQKKLLNWEEKREKERRNMLVLEAQEKQNKGTWDSVNDRRNSLIQRWLFRKRPVNVEPGVGRWVSYLNRERRLDKLVGPCPTTPLAPKGLYIHGNVGSGKTMLMDLFFNATGSVVKNRKRLHFHEAMLNINDQMHKIWKSQVEKKPFEDTLASWIANLPLDIKIKQWIASEDSYKKAHQLKNILPAVADEFLVGDRSDEKGASVLCFDEIQTVDVFAIVALSGILGRLLSTGTVLVATSNRTPRELNQDGMQKEIFQKFVDKLEKHCEIVPIGSEIDYRRFLASNSNKEVLYFWPLESRVQKKFDELWFKIVSQLKGEITSDKVPVMFGRELEVPECCNGAARFTFEYLCGRPLGAADYIALAKNYHTVFISDIPTMSMKIRDKARRFITLIDELYNHHCRLVCFSASSIDDLFRGTDEGTLVDLESFQFETEMEGSKLRTNVLAEGSVSSAGASTEILSMLSGQEEMFAFRRAASRLIEMQTPLYLEGITALHPHS